MNLRYQSGRYLDCSFCQGRGCLACPGEAHKAVKVGQLEENFVAPDPCLQVAKAFEELLQAEPFKSVCESHRAELAALPEHKKGRPRYDEETRVYRDCPLCDGEGCELCPDEAGKEYRRQFPNGVASALIYSIDREKGNSTRGVIF